MSIHKLSIGFSSQRIRYEWVKHAALLGLAGMAGDAMAAELDQYLSENLSTAGRGRRGSREKAITILKRIWAPDTHQLKSLRNDGFKLFRTLPERLHLVVHWGMTMASYPYWNDVSTCVGRLLRLQGTANSTQIQRRMQETYGDREIVARATRNVIRSFISWDVLQESNKKGIYITRTPLYIDDQRLIAWLTEALLSARVNGSAPLKNLINSPSLFPFLIKPIHAEGLVAVSSRLDILHHGLNEDLVMLREPPIKESSA